jgi:hypothetical protein
MENKGIISRAILDTLWGWAVAHGQTAGFGHLLQPYDDSAYWLEYALPAFALDPEDRAVQHALATLPLGYSESPDGTRHWLITGHQLVTTLLPLSATPAAQRILAYRAAGHLVGDIPSGMRRLQEHYGRLLAAIARHGELELHRESVAVGVHGYVPGALTTVLHALDLRPDEAGITPVVQDVRRAEVLTDVDIQRLSLQSRRPEALAFRHWFYGEFVPALRRHGWYDPEHDHALPVRHELQCLEFYEEFRVALAGNDPVTVDILEAYEVVAKYVDIC